MNSQKIDDVELSLEDLQEELEIAGLESLNLEEELDNLEKLGIRDLRKIAREKNITSTVFSNKKLLIEKIRESKIPYDFSDMEKEFNENFPISECDKLEKIDPLYEFDLLNFDMDITLDTLSEFYDKALSENECYAKCVCEKITETNYELVAYKNGIKILELYIVKKYSQEKYSVADEFIVSFLKSKESEINRFRVKDILYVNGKFVGKLNERFYVNFDLINEE